MLNRELRSSNPTIEHIKTVMSIANGGTGVTTSNEVVNSLGGIANDKLGIANGVVQLDSNNKIPLEVLPPFNTETINGPKSLAANAVGVYTITNYDSFKSYTITAVSGVISRSGDTVTYTAPGTAGMSGFSINNIDFDIDILQPAPASPVISTPINGATGVSETPYIEINAFSMLVGTDTHQSTDWQIATDINFTNIVSQSINDTVNKTSWTGLLPTSGIVYYVRARYKGTAYGYGDYSTTISFTAKTSFLPVTEEAKLVANDKAVDDYFGHSVALSSDGSRVIIGSYKADVTSITDSGAAYIYSRSGSTWTLEAKISASDKAANDRFGFSVAINQDATRVAVGSNLADPASVSNAGKAYIFTRSGTTWSQEAILTASNKATGDQFGYFISFTSDANRVAISAPMANKIGGWDDVGAVYIFTRSGTTWTEEISLVPGESFLYDNFGWSLSLSSDGSRIAVGAPYTRKQAGESQGGAVYIYSRSGTTWAQEARIIPADMQQNDYFGYSVSLTSDATRVAIGAYTDDNPNTDMGSVYIYNRSGVSWTQEAKFVGNDITSNDTFGRTVSINSAGNKLAIGSRIGYNTGTVYLFTRFGTTWTQSAKLSPSTNTGLDFFSFSLSISEDGTRIAVGAEANDASGISNSGAVYIFS